MIILQILIIKILRQFTENVQKNHITFLKINTTLPASDPLRFRKICLILIKMAITDQIKTLNRKIMKNEAQYNLDRKAAKISAVSSNNLDKYEHLIGEDLDLKPSTIEQDKFEYSPLGKILLWDWIKKKKIKRKDYLRD